MKITRVVTISNDNENIMLHMARATYEREGYNDMDEYAKNIEFLKDGGILCLKMDGNTTLWIPVYNIAFVEQKRKVICPDCDISDNPINVGERCRLCGGTGEIDLDEVPADEFTNTQT